MWGIHSYGNLPFPLPLATIANCSSSRARLHLTLISSLGFVLFWACMCLMCLIITSVTSHIQLPCCVLKILFSYSRPLLLAFTLLLAFFKSTYKGFKSGWLGSTSLAWNFLINSLRGSSCGKKIPTGPEATRSHDPESIWGFLVPMCSGRLLLVQGEQLEDKAKPH